MKPRLCAHRHDRRSMPRRRPGRPSTYCEREQRNRRRDDASRRQDAHSSGQYAAACIHVGCPKPSRARRAMVGHRSLPQRREPPSITRSLFDLRGTCNLGGTILCRSYASLIAPTRVTPSTASECRSSCRRSQRFLPHASQLCDGAIGQSAQRALASVRSDSTVTQPVMKLVHLLTGYLEQSPRLRG